MRHRSTTSGATSTAEFAADLESVDPGQHEIEDDEIRLVAEMEREAVLSVARGEHRPAFLLQVQPEQVDDVALIVDDQDCLHSGEDTTPGPDTNGRM